MNQASNCEREYNLRKESNDRQRDRLKETKRDTHKQNTDRHLRMQIRAGGEFEKLI